MIWPVIELQNEMLAGFDVVDRRKCIPKELHLKFLLRVFGKPNEKVGKMVGAEIRTEVVAEIVDAEAEKLH